MTDPPDPPGAPPRQRARTIFLGSGSFAVPILRALVLAPEVELVGVVGPPDRPAGREARPSAAPTVALARELGLRLLQPARLRSDEALAEVRSLQPDLGVLADYGRIVPGPLLALPRHGILNVHPSLLPSHRGATPVPATILAGDAQAGVTLILMDEAVDSGPILGSDAWPLDGTEVAPELEARAAQRGAALLRRTLGPWLHGAIEPRAQDESAMTMTRPLRRSDGRLDPTRPVASLERQVRAFQPWPGSWLETVAGRIIVWRAEAMPDIMSTHPTPGRIGRFGLGAADGQLLLREVQPAGGRRMTWDELVRGRPAIVGSEVRTP